MKKEEVSFSITKDPLFLFHIIISCIYKISISLLRRLLPKPKFFSANHNAEIKLIQQQVRRWKDSGCNVPMCTGRPHWQSVSTKCETYKKTFYQININLANILEIDTGKRFVKVEPLVTMGQLTSVLCDLGWMIPVLPELDDLTIGGLVNGFGIETSSHKYGLFHHICLLYEVVLCDGSLIRCTKDENPDLFYAIPGSHGTIGFVVAVDLTIIPTKKYVKIQYLPMFNADDVIVEFTTECKRSEPHFYVEGIMFSSDTGVIMVGDMTDEVEQDKVNDICQFYKCAFYKHVETFLHKKTPGVDYVPLRSYFHRHTRNSFWVASKLIPYVDTTLFRYFFGWLFPPDVQLMKRLQSESFFEKFDNEVVVQDLIVPIQSLRHMIELADETLNIYPIWLCGARIYKQPGFIYPKGNDQLYVDVGLYGIPQVDNYDAVNTIRLIEAFVRQTNGYQATYAVTQMTQGEYREMFDHTLYDQVRSQLVCDQAFPEVYKKVCHRKYF